MRYFAHARQKSGIQEKLGNLPSQRVVVNGTDTMVLHQGCETESEMQHYLLFTIHSAVPDSVYRKGMALLLLANLLFVAGCAEMRSGTVHSARPAWLGGQRFPPYVTAVDSAGREKRVGKIGGPFYALGFIAARAGPPVAHPVLAELARDVGLDDIMVIQLNIPASDERDAQSSETTEVEQPANLVLLSDPDGLAWRAYGQPEPGTVWVVDRMHVLQVIDERGNIANIGAVRYRLRELQQEWEAWQRSNDDI
jgi:hypothetical protein